MYFCIYTRLFIVLSIIIIIIIIIIMTSYVILSPVEFLQL